MPIQMRPTKLRLQEWVSRIQAVPVLWGRRGSLSLSMGVLTSQNSSETFLSWSQLLVNASLCMHNIVLPLQALSGSGAEDNLIKVVLAKPLGCILEYLDKPIPAFAKVFRVVTTIMRYPWLIDPITLWQIGHWEKFQFGAHIIMSFVKNLLYPLKTLQAFIPLLRTVPLSWQCSYWKSGHWCDSQ